MRVLLIFHLMLILLTVPFSFVSAEIRADHGVAASGDMNARDIIIKHGLTEKEVRTIFLELQKEEGASAKKIAELGEKLGVTKSAVKTFFVILGEKQVPDEKLLETLATIANLHLSLLKQAESFRSEDSAVEALREKAKKAIDLGEYDKAEAFLEDAALKELEYARRSQADTDKKFLNTAKIWAEQAELSLTQLNYLEAAKRYKRASETVPATYPEERWKYLIECANSYEQYGDKKGDNQALLEAIKLYNSAFIYVSRERVPLDWAMTQNNLGNALRILGERESGTGRLEEAVTTYREALKERTRERVPLDWAMTQNNLGNALWRLGEQESGTGRLQEAVTAYREALKEYTRERVPLDWAMTQNNLGNALWRLGERESGTGRLEEAVTAYREALKEHTRERVPLDWAMTQNNLGNALWRLGERKQNVEILIEARTVIESSYSLFKEAGYSQYNNYFDKKINQLNKLIEKYNSKISE